MESPATTTPASPVPPAADRPVLAHTTLQPLPKYSVPIAFFIALSLPLILLLVVITIMVSTNYNLLDWME